MNGDILGVNLFAYCSNNPVNRTDDQGTFWDTFFDVVSTAYSAWQVIKNPKDPANWAALAADAVCLAIPGVTGGGTIVRGAKYADEVVSAAKGADRISDGADAVYDAGKIYISKELNSARKKAVKEAWNLEYENVVSGGNGVSRQWSNSEKIELLSTGKVKGYQGHHMKSVSAYPHLAGDATNIQFLLFSDHLKAHGGNWRNPTHGRYLE